MVENFQARGWEEEPLVRLIRQAANGALIAPPPIAEASLRNFLGKHNLPIIVRHL
ncbi:hypothetical protein L6Q21_08635 [Sandaracinobacter sp. RS1-74]|uniref:hypothetical protein n=1 Tax=Sandaracinobacteroides sayramensis TaxID=2913411 RepID=UPI001EDA3028|nr:hypothetical protein [Sandaracinobacteroides sayramensis]MCG2841047.1 hypothetical protein [Sandaracinobacteroides sayramensis]